MEQSYWLRRNRAAAVDARGADGAEARPVHLDLAGRCGVNTATAATEATATQPALALPAGDAAYYQRLETGARWLASTTVGDAERGEHLGMANRYARLRADASGAGR